MNREIKFRAWDTENKSMERVAIFLIDEYKTYPHDRGYIHNCQDWEHHDLISKPVIMQYTGLKDKNGKEIYEGDIVKLWFDEGEEVFWNTFLVKFFEGCFICEFLQGDTEEYPISEYWNDSQDLEIIGNIYENPELPTNN